MQKIFKNIILLIVVFGILIGTSFSPFLSQPVYAQTEPIGPPAPDPDPSNDPMGPPNYDPFVGPPAPDPDPSGTGTGGTQEPTTSAESPAPALKSCVSGFIVVDFPWCVANFFYYVFFIPTSTLFSVAGKLMDFAMEYTLNSDNYGKTSDGTSFVEKGWTITRDLSNLLFIVILLWIAIKMILGMGNDKKLLGTIILIGLLINFSLFFARVVIDASNILGKIFYDNMGVVQEAGNVGEDIKEKSISVAIVSNFNPQKLFSNASTLTLNTGNGNASTGDTGAGTFIVITLIMSVINLVGMYVFAVVAFILIGRVIGLWLLMIIAPIAFISKIMPGSSSVLTKELQWSSWWDSLFKQSFLVPIFLFFLYLILLFMNTGFLKGFKTFDNTTLSAILSVVVPMIIIVGLLLKAKDMATNLSGDVGKVFAKAGATVGGLALGGAGALYGKAVVGSTGAIGRATAGRMGKSLSESKFAINLANSNNSIARGFGSGLQTIGEKASSASFDLRGIKQVQSTTNKYGFKMGDAQKGGLIQDEKNQQKAWEERSQKASKVYNSEEESIAVKSAKLNLEKKKNTVLEIVDGKEKRVRDFEKEYKDTIERKKKELKDLKEEGQKEGNTEYDKVISDIEDIRSKQKNLKKNYYEDEDKAVKDAEKEVRELENTRLKKYADRVEAGVVRKDDGFWKSFGKRVSGNIEAGMPYSNLARADAAISMRKGLEKKEAKEAKEEKKEDKKDDKK